VRSILIDAGPLIALCAVDDKTGVELCPSRAFHKVALFDFQGPADSASPLRGLRAESLQAIRCSALPCASPLRGLRAESLQAIRSDCPA
jgi:hypothetical protein